MCSLGFAEVNYVPAFEEYELQFPVGPVVDGVAKGTRMQCANRDLVTSKAQHAVYTTYSNPADTETL